MRGVVVVAVALCTLGLASSAEAQTLEQARDLLRSESFKAKARLTRQITKEAIKRARRSYVIGPDVGTGVSIAVDGVPDYMVSWGISFTKFSIDIIPNERRLFRFARERATALFTAEMRKAAAAGQRPTNAQLATWAKETAERVVEEVLNELRPRRFEIPSFAARLEGTYLFRGTAGEVRATAGIGLLRVFVSTGVVVGIDNGSADLIAPIEMSVPMTLTLTPWSPLVEGFVRGDIPITGRDERSAAIVVGLRAVMDVI